MILFTADWHIKLGQKNVPLPWACSRYKMIFEAIYDLEDAVDLHIIGGDLFDRVPSLYALTLYFDFIIQISYPFVFGHSIVLQLHVSHSIFIAM